MPYIESIRVIDGVESENIPPQYVARVVVERSEIVAHDDVLPHFEGRQYRSLGWAVLASDGEWKTNHLGREVRVVEAGVVPIEPDGTSFVKMRFSKSLVDPVALMDQAIDAIPPLRRLRDWTRGEPIIASGKKRKKRKR